MTITYPARYPDTSRKTDWRHKAACRSETEQRDELFFAGTGSHGQLKTEEAKRICRRCPVIEQCLQWALETGQEYGVWGGLSEDEIRNVRRHTARPIVTDDYTGTHSQATAMTLSDAWERYTRTSGEHTVWSGATKAVRHEDRALTPNQLGFYMSRRRWPVGMVKRTCQVRHCVTHLQDGEDRGEQTAATTTAPA